MKSENHGYRLTVSVVLLTLAGAISTYAQDGKLTIHVTPKQTYVFVDDRAVGEASKHHSLSLSAGSHKVNWSTTATLRQPGQSRLPVEKRQTSTSQWKPSPEQCLDPSEL